IRSIGQSSPAPLGPEFLRIGDSLLLGNDLQEVMDTAVERVALPEFSFFSVCILLQRDAGGSVAEALENLATIIRARRDLMLKTRALTAESRLSGVVLASLPFLIMALMAFTSPDYIKILFITETGRFLLWLAMAMLLVGIVTIRKLSRMRM